MSAAAGAAVRAFPYGDLEVLTRAEVDEAAVLRRFARAHVRLDAVEASLAALVEEPVRIHARKAAHIDAARVSDDAIGVVLAASGERGSARRVLIEVEGALGAAITTRALRQRAPRVIDRSRAPSPAVAGALAAVIVATLRRAHVGIPLQVVAAGPARALARDLAAAERDVTTAWLAVSIGEDVFEARVSVSAAATASPSAEPMSRDALLCMGEASIAMPLVLVSTLMARAELGALAVGDAFVPAGHAVKIDGAGALSGAVALVPAWGERGLKAELAAGGRLVVRAEGLESHPWTAERSMASDGTTSTTLDVLEDALVVVRVELGALEMTARAWAELGTGDVVMLGRKIGDPATLRVGGVELARGELVQVDGEMAVRILARPAPGAGGDVS